MLEELGQVTCALSVARMTCSDGADVVVNSCVLPELAVGDYVLFPSLGAYSWAGAADFNGFACRDIRFMHVYS